MEDTIKRTPSLTLDGTTTSQTILLEDGRWGSTDLIFPTSSSLVVTVTVSGETHTETANPTDFVDTVVNTPTATSYAAGASITVAAGAILSVSTLNKTAVKVSRVSGSGTVVLSASPLPSSAGSAGTFALLQSAIKNEDVASAGADPGMVVNAMRQDTPANTSGTDGDYEPLRMSAGRLWGSDIITDIVPGTGATKLGKAEDAGHTSGDTGVMALAVRNDTPAALAGTTLDYIPLTTDANGAVWASLATLISGEDLTTNRMLTEQRFSYSGVKVADALIKSGAGFLHSIQIEEADAAPTAGTIQIRDATSAGTGTVIWEWNLTTAVFTPANPILNVSFATGLYIDFTTTGDVNVSVSYR